MGKSNLILEKSKQSINSASYLLTKTYPLIKEEKLFLEIIKHLNNAAVDLIEYLVVFSFEKGHLKKVPKDLTDKLLILKNNDVKKTDLNNKIGHQLAKLQQKLYGYLDCYQNDLMSFKRGENYVICKKNYIVEVISANLLQELLDQIRKSYDQLNNLK